MTQHTRTQKMALAAYQAVEQRKGSKLEAEYRTLALTFPNMVLQSGLMQAIGFMLAKSNESGGDPSEHRAYLSDLVKVLAQPTADAPATLHQQVLRSSVRDYQLMTRLVLDAASWLKRYTQALLEKESKRELTP